MQYLGVAFFPDDEFSEFDYNDVDTGSGEAVLVPASQVLRTINRLSRDENWEIFAFQLEDLAQGAGAILLQRPGIVPASH